jgi:hypothetical protein
MVFLFRLIEYLESTLTLDMKKKKLNGRGDQIHLRTSYEIKINHSNLSAA